MSVINTKQNLSFMDAAWLQTYGLSRQNVLDYFYISPFYDLNSNNQLLRAQLVDTSHLTSMVGLEFILDTNMLAHEPTLFLIKKQYRKSSHHVDILEVYYVMEGIIYQSPCFINLLMLKYNKINLYLQQTFQCCLQNVQHENGGHQCLNHSSVIPVTGQRTTVGGAGGGQQYVKIREFPNLQTTFDDLDLMLTSLTESLEGTAERAEEDKEHEAVR
jgi:hypothetical protein